VASLFFRLRGTDAPLGDCSLGLFFAGTVATHIKKTDDEARMANTVGGSSGFGSLRDCRRS
jgi:hypothetical protein